MIRKSDTDCPCIDCPDRQADPNCHGENGHCPHGYLDWKAGKQKKKEEADKARRADNMSIGYVVDKVHTLKRRHSWDTKKR